MQAALSLNCFSSFLLKTPFLCASLVDMRIQDLHSRCQLFHTLRLHVLRAALSLSSSSSLLLSADGDMALVEEYHSPGYAHLTSSVRPGSIASPPYPQQATPPSQYLHLAPLCVAACPVIVLLLQLPGRSPEALSCTRHTCAIGHKFLISPQSAHMHSPGYTSRYIRTLDDEFILPSRAFHTWQRKQKHRRVSFT